MIIPERVITGNQKQVRERERALKAKSRKSDH